VLIIFGLRVFYRTIAQGTFHCRRCGGDRQYRHRAGRRWFTLFFLPVIPLNSVGEHVQCTTCRTRYVTDALGQPTTAQMQAALTGAEFGGQPLIGVEQPLTLPVGGDERPDHLVDVTPAGLAHQALLVREVPVRHLTDLVHPTSSRG